MAEYIKVYYKKFWEHAKVPDGATPFSAGSDLYSAFEYCIPKQGQTAIDTGIGAVIPPTHQGINYLGYCFPLFNKFILFSRVTQHHKYRSSIIRIYYSCSYM